MRTDYISLLWPPRGGASSTERAPFQVTSFLRNSYDFRLNAYMKSREIKSYCMSTFFRLTAGLEEKALSEVRLFDSEAI